MTTLARDVARAAAPAEPSLRVLVRLILDPGLRCVLILRLQLNATRRRLRLVAWLLRSVNLSWHGIDVVQGCRIGPGLLIRHPTGIVLGGGAVIGADCTVMQGVTVGEALSPKRPDDSAYPVIGDGVLLGANSVVLGAVVVGDRATVGANSVVTSDVAAGTTVVGAPARPVTRDR